MLSTDYLPKETRMFNHIISYIRKTQYQLAKHTEAFLCSLSLPQNALQTGTKRQSRPYSPNSLKKGICKDDTVLGYLARSAMICTYTKQTGTLFRLAGV